MKFELVPISDIIPNDGNLYFSDDHDPYDTCPIYIGEIVKIEYEDKFNLWDKQKYRKWRVFFKKPSLNSDSKEYDHSEELILLICGYREDEELFLTKITC